MNGNPLACRDFALIDDSSERGCKPTAEACSRREIHVVGKRYDIEVSFLYRNVFGK